MRIEHLYGIWKRIRKECKNSKIEFEWDSFYSFQDWCLSNGYKKGLQFKRKDINKNYSSKNCVWIKSKSHDRLHYIWVTLKQKCNNPNSDGFIYAGGKGLILYEEWDNYNIFEKWAINNGYGDNLVLSRKDMTDDFYPENCEWITGSEHKSKNNKTKKPIWIEYNNKKQLLSEWARELNIGVKTLYTRYHNNKTGQELFSTIGLRKR